MTTAAGDPAGGEVSSPARAALRLLSLALMEELDTLADRLTLLVLRAEPSYAELGVSAPDALRENLRANLQRGIQSLGGLVPAGVDPQDTSRETGRLRAREGVPLEAVLRAYRLGGQVIWEALLSASRERFRGRYDRELLATAGHVWRAIDASSAALVDDYRLEESRLRSQELSKRHAFLNALLDGQGADAALAQEAATVLGLPTCGPMLCVVAPVDTATDEPLRSPRDALAAHGIVSSWHVRPSDIVGLVALGDRSPADALAALRPSVTGRAGASPVITSLAQVADAYTLARTAARTLCGAGVAFLDDHLPEALLVGSPELTGRLVRVAFGGLLDLPAHERETLFSTLEAVIDSGGSPTRAAQRLYCHRNTVIYRLQRVEAVTGRSPSKARDRLLLNLGLLALRRSGDGTGTALSR
ncbi:PucR family transcriptional regulator [Saccharomonospora piscinae]|uniref:PucR family transcriptional regulator n=1 Tax=Saccharomonospora piscinae TaxID=687388 RepID=UPI000463BC18|nr:helix-turn-helix domain-containing protein [Saccharomonospora piscinae]